MKHIRLTRGYVALVDDEDYTELSKHKWHAQDQANRRLVYAARYDAGTNVPFLMHLALMPWKHGYIVDHVDGDGLNNQRHNLRYATPSQSQHNRTMPRGTSKYRGVTWDKQAGKWRAAIKVNYRSLFLGLYTNEEEAALAYNQAALEQYGVFARLNLLVGNDE